MSTKKRVKQLEKRSPAEVANDQGREAFKNGATVDACPYKTPAQAGLRDSWFDGFYQPSNT
jgi:ribosome modulation factor